MAQTDMLTVQSKSHQMLIYQTFTVKQNSFVIFDASGSYLLTKQCDVIFCIYENKGWLSYLNR